MSNHSQGLRKQIAAANAAPAEAVEKMIAESLTQDGEFHSILNGEMLG